MDMILFKCCNRDQKCWFFKQKKQNIESLTFVKNNFTATVSSSSN